MNYSAFKERVYGYLSFREIKENEDINRIISESLVYLSENDTFRYRYAEYDEPLPFMKSEPYASFLRGSSGYYLAVSTLGSEIDRKIKRIGVNDMTKMIIFDACANAYLEIKNEEMRDTLGDDLSYLFCPGYQGSKASDMSYILDELKASRLGIELLPSGMMVPQKSMSGIYAKGISPRKKCGNCLKINDCAYRKAGKLCFDLEKK